VVYIDQHKYIDLGLRPQSTYFCLVDITTYRPHAKAIIVQYCEFEYRS